MSATLCGSLISMPVLPLTIILATLCILRMFLDIYYLLRMISVICTEWLFSFSSIGFLDKYQTSVTVLTVDLDHFGHMNNSRYNRECDFSRNSLLLKSGFMTFVYRNGHSLSLAATTLRFRRSMNLFDTAWCTSRVVYWDDRSLYVEQGFSRKSDGFLYAVGYSKLMTKTAPIQQVLEEFGFEGERPTPDEDLLSWIQYIDQSSAKLKTKAS